MTHSYRKKLLSVEVLTKAARQVAQAARARGEPVALVGGLAMISYGSDRLTADLDVIANTTLGFAEQKPLSFGGIKTDVAGVPTDIIVRVGEHAELYEEALRYARDGDIDGPKIVGPEYLVAMKMVAGRDKDDLDLMFLLIEEVVDIPKTRRILKRLLGIYAVQVFDSLVEEAAWKRSKRENE